MTEAAASEPDRIAGSLDRRAMLRRLAATSAVAWAAPEVLATKRASAMALSGCYIEYTFDNGTLQGWIANNLTNSGWQVSNVHSFSGGFSAWFGHANARTSLYPVRNEPSYRQGNRTHRGTLTSPSTTVAATDMVCFTIRLAIESSANFDTLRFFIVQGGARVRLWDKSQGGFAVLDHPEDPSGPHDMLTTEGGWSTIEVAVGTPSGINLNNPVQFEFDFQTVDGNFNRTEGIYLDNIVLPCTTAPVSTSRQSSSAARLTAPIDSGYLQGYRPPPEIRPSETREAPKSNQR